MESTDSILIYSPDPRMFESYAPSIRHRMIKEATHVQVFNGISTPKSGGVFINYLGALHPEKGMKFPEAGYAIALIKKIMLIILSMFSSLGIKVPANHLAELCNLLMDRYFMLKQFHIPVTRGVRQISYLFMLNLGIAKSACSTISKTIAHFPQYDDAYRGRIQDIVSMTTKERLLANPRREVKRLYGLYKRREQADDMKLGSIFKLLYYAMLIPKVKRAFREAVRLTDIDLMKYDEADMYNVLVKSKYDYMGWPVEYRKKTYLALHGGQIPPWVEFIHN